MAFDQAGLQSWVNGLGLSDTEKTSVLASFGRPEVLSKVGDSILAQSDYSRRMDELKTKENSLQSDFQKRIADEEKKTTDFVNSTGSWKAEKEKILNDAIAARAAAENALAKVQADIKNVYTEFGIPEDRLPKVASTMTPTPTPSNNDLPNRDLEGKFASKDYVEGLANNVLKLPAIISRLDREYERLFGREAPLVDWEKVIDDARASKRTLVQEFETQFKVPERRAAIAKEAHDREIADAEKRGAESARSKLLAENPGFSTNVRTDDRGHSPILVDAARRADAAREAAKTSGHPVVDEGRGVRAAITAFREGRYKDGKAA